MSPLWFKLFQHNYLLMHTYFRYHNSRMINYDQREGINVDVTGISNKSMRLVYKLWGKQANICWSGNSSDSELLFFGAHPFLPTLKWPFAYQCKVERKEPLTSLVCIFAVPYFRFISTDLWRDMLMLISKDFIKGNLTEIC